MLHFNRFKAIVASLLAACALAVPFRKADAAVFVGTFDPAFGLAFPRLGFNGSATFQIADSCLSVNGFCTDTPIDLTSATVTLYDSLNPASNDVLNFGGAALNDVYIQAGILIGVNSPIVGPQFAVVNDGIVYQGNVYLQFELLSFGGEGVGTPHAFIFACSASNSQCSANDAIRSNAATVTFTRVAEPATIGLVLTALAGLAWRRRRS